MVSTLPLLLYLEIFMVFRLHVSNLGKLNNIYFVWFVTFTTDKEKYF